ncbi:hypothetical protein [Burkholderia sp. Ac-20379]|nr:hypothetical protein [Burkholderia sp. Ac-20379]MBN3726466.1 hypothetical protein [Burkholderia sp. Ac-20379]
MDIASPSLAGEPVPIVADVPIVGRAPWAANQFFLLSNFDAATSGRATP